MPQPPIDLECPHCRASADMLEAYDRGWVHCNGCSAMLLFDGQGRCIRSSKIARGEALFSPKAWDDTRQE